MPPVAPCSKKSTLESGRRSASSVLPQNRTYGSHIRLLRNGILKNFRVTFDYANSVMFLENQNKSSESANYDRSGMWIGKNGDSWVVFDVVKYGPADRAGIKLGDQIEKIDG